MDYSLQVVVAVVLVTATTAIAIHVLSRSRSKSKKRLPPGSLGLPLIGQTLAVVRAWRTNSLDRWILDRIDRYGQVSKLSLFCTPTVLMEGPAANKFVLFSSRLRVVQPQSLQRMMGEKSIIDLHGAENRPVRGALMEFLGPDMLKLYIGRIDAEVRQHLEEKWRGRTAVTVLPLMKRLTFGILCQLVFGLEAGAVRDALAAEFELMAEAIFAIPVNLPFTTFGRSLKASRRARQLLEGVMGDRKASPPNNDHLVTRLLSLKDDRGAQLLTDEEILGNGMLTIFAGFDATAILMTFIVRCLGNDPATLDAMVQEHEEIASSKADGEQADLVWEDLSKMKFTWRVAQETLRIVPPSFSIIRTALEDLEFDGYCIPKGWQVCLASDVTHMDPRIFHEPARFDPSRFENLSSAPWSYIPFGAGPRICPAIEFTRIQTLVTMHNLVRQFRWKEDTLVRDPLSLPPDGLSIQLQHMTTSP